MPICNVAVLALVAFARFLRVCRRWSVNLLSMATAVTLVVATSCLFLAGFAYDDTVKVATWVDGQLTYAPAPDPTYSNDDPGVCP